MIDGIDIDEPDWTAFDGRDTMENVCACDAVWHSHVKVVNCKPAPDGGKSRGMVLVAREPCPGCGSRTKLRRSSSAPERWTL